MSWPQIEKADLPREIFKYSKYGRASYLIKAKSEKNRIERKIWKYMCKVDSKNDESSKKSIDLNILWIF